MSLPKRGADIHGNLVTRADLELPASLDADEVAESVEVEDLGPTRHLLKVVKSAGEMSVKVSVHSGDPVYDGSAVSDSTITDTNAKYIEFVTTSTKKKWSIKIEEVKSSAADITSVAIGVLDLAKEPSNGYVDAVNARTAVDPIMSSVSGPGTGVFTIHS